VGERILRYGKNVNQKTVSKKCQAKKNRMSIKDDTEMS